MLNHAVKYYGLKKNPCKVTSRIGSNQCEEIGFSPVDIAQRLGHESYKITLNYAHMFPSKQDEMTKKLKREKVINNGKAPKLPSYKEAVKASKKKTKTKKEKLLTKEEWQILENERKQKGKDKKT